MFTINVLNEILYFPPPKLQILVFFIYKYVSTKLGGKRVRKQVLYYFSCIMSFLKLAHSL